MKIRVAAIIFAAAFLMQGTLLNIFSLWGVTPNLILCLLIVFTFFYENENAVYLALAFGLISDICFANIVGVSSLGYLLIGFLIARFRYILNKDNVISILILGVSGTILFDFFYWVFTSLGTNEASFVYFLEMQPLYLVSNLIVIILLYFALINKVVKNRNDRYYR